MNIAQTMTGPATAGPSPDHLSGLEKYLERYSALELARRSLIGAPVFAVISLVMLVGTPFFSEYGWAVSLEAFLIVALSVIRISFARGFESRYDRIGERAVFQFNLLTALQSLVLGVIAGVTIWHYWSSKEIVLTIALCAACVAAGTSALSVRRSARAIFLLCILLPFGISVWMVGGPMKALLIVGFLVLMAYLVQDGGTARRLFMQQMRTRYDTVLARNWTSAGKAARERFMADLNHELRTPINSIVGMTTLLLDEKLDRRTQELATIIRNSGYVLLDLLENRIDCVDCEAAQDKQELNEYELKQEVGQVIKRFRERAEAKNIELNAEIDDLPDSVSFFDENHVEQVLVNLLENAIEHTNKGSVTVQSRCKTMADEVVQVEFAVTDSGKAVSKKLMGSLFELAGAPGMGDGDEFGGGIALPMSKGLTELMGGSIWAETNDQGGTTICFSVRVQLDEADSKWRSASAISKRYAKEFPSDLSQQYPLRVLVVDDHEINRSVLCHLLEKMGYKPDEADDGTEAVVSVMRDRYDLIFMDVRMPNMSGIEATRWIREHHHDQHLCIVALTGEATEDARDRCRDAGMNGFLAKPINVSDLEGILRHAAKGLSGHITFHDESIEHWV